MVQARTLLFRLFYSTSFTLAFMVLIAFICVSPADALYESYKRRRLIDIFFVSGTYVVTALVAALIYASRLYTTRVILKDIPKTYIPLEKEDLPGKRTWRLIGETVKRSAVLAYLARPRARRVEMGDFDEDLQHEQEGEETGESITEKVNVKERLRAFTRPELRKSELDHEDEMAIIMDMGKRWGPINHAGWSSPANTQMPSLEYRTVVAELMNLVEAKAVSLAPLSSDPAPLIDSSDDGRDLIPDIRVVEALTRPKTMGMRQYVSRLIELEVLPGNSLTVAFLTLYERARFSVEPLAEAEFQNLMHLFAELLRTMKQVNTELALLVDDSVDTAGSDHDDGDSDGGDDHESKPRVQENTSPELRGRGPSAAAEQNEYTSDRASLRSVDRKSLAKSLSSTSSASSINGSVRRLRPLRVITNDNG